MNILSLFDGMSCGQIALERANIKVDKYFASEIDKYAIKVTQTNYPNTIQLGDISQIYGNSLPKINILIGGSPCQDLSIAKQNRKGLKGVKSSLFWEYVRILKETNPKYFLLENVASMKNSDKDFISKILNVEPIIINSSLVSAQNRKRLYWTNIPIKNLPLDKEIILTTILEKEPVNEKFYLQKKYKFLLNNNNKSKTGMKFVAGIISKKIWLDNGKTFSRNFPQGNRIYSSKGKSASLSANGGGLGAKTGLYLIGDTLSNETVRRLTPIECERLQTVPDDYTSCVSNTQRYKMLGNGWTVDVIVHILNNLNKGEQND